MSAAWRQGITALACAFMPAVGLAQNSPTAIEWLRKIHESTQRLSYSGTFVYRQGDRAETSRITRIAGKRGGVERLEVLDGSPREIVRNEDGVRCYLPELRIVKVDRPGVTRRFPAVVSEQFRDLERYYTVQLGDMRRVADHECQTITLTPRDEYRYGYSLCADRATGLPVQSVTLNEHRQPVEQFTFTELLIGKVSRDRVKAPTIGGDWKVEEATVEAADLARRGWLVHPVVPGFRKIVEVTRTLQPARPVGQIVYSDGLAAVSVFIESVVGRSQGEQEGLASMGGINIYTRRIADHVVTVVGEAPAVSVQRIGDEVRFRRVP